MFCRKMELIRQERSPFVTHLTARARRWPIYPVGFSVLSCVAGRGVRVTGDNSVVGEDFLVGKWGVVSRVSEKRSMVKIVHETPN